MRAPRHIKNVTAGVLALCTLLIVSTGHAQDETAEECGIDTPFTEGYLVVTAGVEDCEVLRKIEKATKRFFDAECKLLEARSRTIDPRSYAVVNQLVEIAQLEFAEASALFFEVSGQINSSLAVPESEDAGRAGQILEVYGYWRPKSYLELFKILGDVTGVAAEQLSEVEFQEDTDQAAVIDSMYSLTGAMMRPGGVYRAIAVLLRESVA